MDAALRFMAEEICLSYSGAEGLIGWVRERLTDDEFVALQIYGDIHSVRDAAEILGIPRATFHDRLVRARQKIIPEFVNFLDGVV